MKRIVILSMIMLFISGVRYGAERSEGGEERTWRKRRSTSATATFAGRLFLVRGVRF